MTKQDRDEFAGKVAVVTGGAAGIGRATVKLFLERGAHVVVGDVSETAGKALLLDMQAISGTIAFIKTDVTVPADCERLIAHALDKFGRLDIAVNNAGIIGQLRRTANFALEEWQRVLDVNLTGVFNCLVPEIKAMENKGGAIVNMSSILGLVGSFGIAAYSASKHGVIGLTKSCAMEYGQRNIRVNAVCPGFVDTHMIEGSSAIQDIVGKSALKRLGNPVEIAETVLWLCSDRASFVTGTAITVDGGTISSA